MSFLTFIFVIFGIFLTQLRRLIRIKDKYRGERIKIKMLQRRLWQVSYRISRTER